MTDIYNEANASLWDDTRDFLAAHYAFNQAMNTPFWQHCRTETNLGSAAPLVNFYRENGPSSMCKGYHISGKNSFGLEGYFSILLGQQLSHQRPHTPSEAETKLWEKHLAEMAQVAKRAYTVKQALEIIRSPKWKWGH